MVTEGLVSIVITSHNYARFVGHAIESALGQRGVDVEVIVVDDGSTDGSVDVIESFGRRVIALLRPNGGQGAAFNAGWRVCRGDTVIFLDADDVLAPDIAAQARAQLHADRWLVRVQYPLEVIDGDGAPTGASVPERPSRLFAGDAVPRLATAPDDLVWQPTSGNAFDRRALDAIMPMPEAPYRICADYYLSNLVPLHGGVAALAQIGGGYRVHGANRHWARDATLERLRANIVRTSITHELLWGEGRRLGVAGWPVSVNDLRSVTDTANRLLAHRMDRAEHPLAGDTRMRLIAGGVAAACGRHDRTLAGRVSMALWFVAAGLVPRPWLRAVARPYGRIELPTRQWRALIRRTRRIG